MTHTFKRGDQARVIHESAFAAEVGDVVTILDGLDEDGDYPIRNHNNEGSVYVEAACIEPVADEPVDDAPVDVTPNEPVIPASRVAEVLSRFHAAASIFDVVTIENIARSLGFEITPPQPARFTFKETF